MKMKQYIAPATEIMNMSGCENLLDWIVGSPFEEGEGDVDAKVAVVDQDDEWEFYEEEEEVLPRFTYNVWGD